MSTDPITRHDNDLLPPEVWHGHVYSAGWHAVGAVSHVMEPATGSIIGCVGMADAATVSAAAKRARSAQSDWAAASSETRAAIFRKAAELADTHADEIVNWLVREGGSTLVKARYELQVSVKAIRLAGAMPHEAQGLVLPSEPGRISLAKRRPLGVVGVISPFNFPLYLAMRAVAPAIAIGNAVVLKPDPRTSVCGGFVIARLFELAGLPEGVLHVLPGAGDAGEALCSDSNIAMIQFTGSTNAGRIVGQTASKNLKKVSLELGGKNALIILEDADLELAVRNTLWGAYLNQGQICMAAGRVLVHNRIAEVFSQKLAERANALVVGDPTRDDVAIGPIINQKQLDHIASVVAATVSAGARLAAGGTSEGLFYAPTVLTHVRPGMPAFDQEIFGPVAVVTTFDSDDEAVKLANQTDYGLSAAVISKNVSRALALGERLRTGLLHINDQTVNDDVVNPFGGVGASGNGTSIGGPSNWEEFSQWQWVTIRAEPPAYAL